mgnify:CR=1 FL=1
MQDLDAEISKEETNVSRIALMINALRRSLHQEAQEATGNNEIRSKLSSEHITDLMSSYTNKQLASAQLITDALARIARDLVYAMRRDNQY